MHLIISHGQKSQDDSNPVNIIRDNRTVRGRVLPAKDSVENAPSATAVEFGVAKLGESEWRWNKIAGRVNEH